MTYKRLKDITAGLLILDVELPNNPDVVIALLEMAYGEVATHANAFRLLTLSKGANILRKGDGDYCVRIPELPEKEDEELDLDNELGFAVARILASYISEKKAVLHMREARRLIAEYNSKTAELLDSVTPLPHVREEY